MFGKRRDAQVVCSRPVPSGIHSFLIARIGAPPGASLEQSA